MARLIYIIFLKEANFFSQCVLKKTIILKSSLRSSFVENFEAVFMLSTF